MCFYCCAQKKFSLLLKELNFLVIVILLIMTRVYTLLQHVAGPSLVSPGEAMLRPISWFASPRQYLYLTEGSYLTLNERVLQCECWNFGQSVWHVPISLTDCDYIDISSLLSSKWYKINLLIMSLGIFIVST